MKVVIATQILSPRHVFRFFLITTKQAISSQFKPVFIFWMEVHVQRKKSYLRFVFKNSSYWYAKRTSSLSDKYQDIICFIYYICIANLQYTVPH